MSVFEWKHATNRAPYARFAQKAPTSHARWWLTLTNELDDTAYAKRKWNVAGPVLDLSPLSAAERAEFHQLASMLRRDQTAEELAREQELLARLPRLTVSGGYDIDTSEDAAVVQNGDAIRAACDELHRRLMAEETKRGMVLRQCWSGDPARGKRHLEWGHAVEGHVNLLRAMLGRARDVCKAVGLVQRTVTTAAGRSKTEDRMWVLPEDPTGALAFLDLSNLERAPASRSSTFRLLGGWHKDRRFRKALMEGSPERGSAITPDMIAEGLRLYEAQEREAGRRPRRTPTQNLGPRSITLPIGEEPEALPNSAIIMGDWWSPGVGHNLRMSTAGALARSGLMSQATIVNLLGQATGNVEDARTTVLSTVQRLRQGAPVRGAGSLREDVGSTNVFNLAWAMSHDMRHYAFAWIYSKLAVTRINEKHELKALCERLEKLAAETENTDEKKVTHRVRRRLQASAWCGRRRVDGRCPCCQRVRCRKHLNCGDPSCPPCTLQKVQDVIELVKLPRHTTILHQIGYRSKKDAEAARKRVKGFGDKPPLALYTPCPDGTWDLTLMIDSSDAMGVAGAAAIGGEQLDRVLPHVARNWIARSLIQRHITARHAIESKDAPVHILLEAYRKHMASGRGTSIEWPTKEQMRQLRIKKAEEARRKNASNPDAAEPDECECTEAVTSQHPAIHEVVDVDTGAVTIDNLASAPTLALVIAHELGERVRLHKRRRFAFRWRMRSSAAAS